MTDYNQAFGPGKAPHHAHAPRCIKRALDASNPRHRAIGERAVKYHYTPSNPKHNE